MKLFGIDLPGYITGLLNKTFDKNNYVSGRAATEDQLAALAASIQTDTNTITLVQGAGGISVTDAGTQGNHDYTVKPGSQMTVGSTEQGSTDNPIFIDGQSGYLDGLSNTTWDTTPPQGGGPPNNPISGRAATEDQLAAAIASVTDNDHIAVVEAASSGNVSVSSSTSGNTTTYTVNTGETITGLTNTTWSGTATSGRAATEDQLAALADEIPTVEGGDDINVSESNGTYTVDLIDDYMVYSLSPNIIVTAEGDGSDNEIFQYDASKTGLTATNNKIANFVTTKQKIQLAGTGLTAGTLPAFGDATTGVYWDANEKNLLVNGKAVVNILNGAPVAADIEILS